MQSAEPSVTGTDLVSQVSPENVLAVGNVLARHAAAIRRALVDASLVDVERCGDDPVSVVATPVFDRKYKDLLALHGAHQAELEKAVARLRAIATSYRLGEDEISASFDV